MRKFFNRLRPIERRLVIGGLVVLFILVNVTSVWPHFRDWGEAKTRLAGANDTIKKFNVEISHTSEYEKKIRALEQQGGSVSKDDQANAFLDAVRMHAARSGVNLTGTSRQTTKTNEFFLELTQAFGVQSAEPELVNFLYNLGSSDSMIRVRELTLRPDGPRQQLAGSVKLLASYQKNKAAPRAKIAASPTKPVVAAPKPEVAAPKPAGSTPTAASTVKTSTPTAKKP